MTRPAPAIRSQASFGKTQIWAEPARAPVAAGEDLVRGKGVLGRQGQHTHLSGATQLAYQVEDAGAEGPWWEPGIRQKYGEVGWPAEGRYAVISGRGQAAQF